MGKVQDCARALGEAIVASEEYQNMQLCEKATESDPAAAEAMGRYMELHAAVNQEMGNEEPDAEKIAQYGREMDELQQTLNSMPSVEAMTAARQRFSELMNQVNQILEFIITGDVQPSGGCSGNCSACGGCH